MAIMVAGLFLFAEPVMGYVVEPMVYGHSTGLSPLAVIVAAIFWTWLWGPIGLLLSTPITLCLVVLGRHVPQMEFIDVLFGDRPALTPVESFYQRMLAGDADEVLDQAELLLKDRSLSSYYDEVVVPGLRLALTDRRRGVISGECLNGIVDATRELVEALDDHQDIDPTNEEAVAEPASASLAEQALPERPPPQTTPSDGVIFCQSGPGPADPALAAMLVQLLAKHGQHATTENAADPALVCLVGVELRPSLPRWRALEARARQRWPKTRIVKGLLRLGRASAIDSCQSLRDLVERCADAARERNGSSETFATVT